MRWHYPPWLLISSREDRRALRIFIISTFGRFHKYNFRLPLQPLMARFLQIYGHRFQLACFQVSRFFKVFTLHLALQGIRVVSSNVCSTIEAASNTTLYNVYFDDCRRLSFSYAIWGVIFTHFLLLILSFLLVCIFVRVFITIVVHPFFVIHIFTMGVLQFQSFLHIHSSNSIILSELPPIFTLFIFKRHVMLCIYFILSYKHTDMHLSLGGGVGSPGC